MQRNHPIDPRIAREAVNWDEDARKIFNEELAYQRLNLADEQEEYVKAWHYDPVAKKYYPLLGNAGLMPLEKAMQAYNPGEMVSYNVTNVPHLRKPMSGYSAGKIDPKSQEKLLEYGVQHDAPKGKQLVFTRVVGGKAVDPKVGGNMTHGNWHIYSDAMQIDPSDQKVIRKMPDFRAEADKNIANYTSEFINNELTPDDIKLIIDTYLNSDKKTQYIDHELGNFLTNAAQSTELDEAGELNGVVLGQQILNWLNNFTGNGLDYKAYTPHDFKNAGFELLLNGEVEPEDLNVFLSSPAVFETLLAFGAHKPINNPRVNEIYNEFKIKKFLLNKELEVNSKKEARLVKQFNTDIVSAPRDIKRVASNIRDTYKLFEEEAGALENNEPSRRSEGGYSILTDSGRRRQLFFVRNRDALRRLAISGYMLPEFMPYLDDIVDEVLLDSNNRLHASPKIKARIQSQKNKVNVNDLEAFNEGAASGGISDALVKTIHRRF